MPTEKLKQIFRIHKGFTSWHLSIVIGFGFSLGGYLGAGFSKKHQGIDLILHTFYGIFIAITLSLISALIDFFIFRRAFLHFKSQGDQKSCENLIKLSMAFSFIWIFIAFAISYFAGRTSA